MNVTQFQDLVDRHGEDLRLWPDAFRAPAEQFLHDCDAARAIVDRAVALRTALAALPPIKAPRGLAARIAARLDDEAGSDDRNGSDGAHRMSAAS